MVKSPKRYPRKIILVLKFSILLLVADQLIYLQIIIKSYQNMIPSILFLPRAQTINPDTIGPHQVKISALVVFPLYQLTRSEHQE